jgi:hypothetical protein
LPFLIQFQFFHPPSSLDEQHLSFSPIPLLTSLSFSYHIFFRLVNFCSLFNFSENDEEKNVARLRSSSSLFSFFLPLSILLLLSIKGFFLFSPLFWVSSHFYLPFSSHLHHGEPFFAICFVRSMQKENFLRHFVNVHRRMCTFCGGEQW